MRTKENVFTSRSAGVSIITEKLIYVKHYVTSADTPSVHNRVDSRIRASNDDELDCNTPRYRRKVLILLHHVMNRMYLLHIHLSVCQKTTPSPHYPSNCLFETYLVVFRIAANRPDMHVLCTDFLYHCDVIALLWDVDEPGLGRVAYSISFPSQLPDIDHPTTIREYKSRITAR